MSKRTPKRKPKQTRSQVGKRSKRKGDNFERTLSNDLQKAYGTPGAKSGDREFYRTPLSGGMKTEYPGDIVIPDWFPFMIEAKKRESIGDLSSIFSRKRGHTVFGWFVSEGAKAKKLQKSLMLVFARNYSSKLCCIATKHLEQLVGATESGITDCLFSIRVGALEVSIFPWADFLKIPEASLRAFAKADQTQEKSPEWTVGPIIPLPPASPK